MDLKEFFAPLVNEGPLDPAFKGPATAEVDPVSSSAEEPVVTQAVAPVDSTEFSMFAKNTQSTVSSFENLQQSGLDTAALDQFAMAIDELAQALYAGVQDPQKRVDFVSDYQGIAAGWNKQLSSLLTDLNDLAKAAGKQM